MIVASGSAAAGVAWGWLAGRFTAAAPGVALIIFAYAMEALLLAGPVAATAALAGSTTGLGGRALATRRLVRRIRGAAR